MENRPCVLTLEGRGDASFNYAVTLKDFNMDFKNQKKEFQDLMRKVNLGIVGKDYVAKDPLLVKYLYVPCLAKQQIYYNLPYNIPTAKILSSSLIDVRDPEIWIYDAFSCMGDKFNLKDLNVFVELKYSNMSCGILWAEIYYVADCIIPAMIIRPQFIHL
jgi:hypothetical protein